jgi:hypothetical protein
MVIRLHCNFTSFKVAWCNNLARGVLIGSIGVFDCKGDDWHLRKPERADKLVPQTKKPQPVWFYPF